MRGRSYSPSPPRGYGRRGRSPIPRGGHYGGRSRDEPTTLLVRNLRHDCRPEDLKKPFGQIGPVKDIYLPRDYYTREPRGFGFIQYLDAADAEEAKYQMDGQVFQGRPLTVVFAEENRKKPQEMRARERGSGRGGRNYDRRGTPTRYHNPPRYSRSPPPRGRNYYSPPKRRQYSRSVSPEEKRYSRERSYSQSPPREESPPFNGSRSRSQSPVREHAPPYGSRSHSRSPVRARSPVRGHSRRRSPSQSHSRSPDAVRYSRNPDSNVPPRR
ncbi:serine/arginine-rich SC35-like splicing factor SCL30A isoform X1 [Capsicum chacoense]|uniref:serine/arginine-rich SC35-like splicing factor SCL30A isoform X1 n=1 Tax=Capsicum annuum TaxID=4072 RepID=UPI0007BFD4DB|nr:serine/arginine-rich SC35-like splicing factor SCL30A isoform X1 [Capsicum annuum]XP_016550071.1 serine/arginine-rich SC35-like splicing factor SCL30A isoform X1 [Capsicum annuum]XP_016550072.1 serine/arginine-rich SC35-like splicing factor SCL30A isoform X1 [Capsicum annuum]